VHDSGGGQPVLLLHGVGCGADDWIGPAKHFRGQFHVIRVDMRGHGRSSSPAGDWRLADFIDDLVAILDRLGVERTHVAGFSMGGLLAQGLALEHPDRVEKLAILAATSGRKNRHQTLVLTGERDLGAGPPVARFIAEQISGAHLIILPRLRHHILLEAPEVVGGILREFFSDAD
jgi:pimeloyl-ACP methyl ester carboxylesterase